MKRIILIGLVMLMVCVTGCEKKSPEITQNGTEPTKPTVTEASPQVTQPEETKPSKPVEPIAPQGTMINNMVLRATIGNQAEQVVQNPTASIIYNYIISQRKDAKEGFPANTTEDYINSSAELSFVVGEKIAARVYFFEDDYVGISIDADSENSACRYYKFPDGAYDSLLLTLQQK